MILLDKYRAEKCHAEGMELSARGETELALAKYFEALKWHEARANTYYNIGLIYKYRNDWSASFKHNKRAVELHPNDEASNWNLAIAATGLRDWYTARQVWNSLGFSIESGDTEIVADFGITPVRLNPDGDAEVVWATRIDPVRARILSIPFSKSGYRYGDVVLHDGAAVGYRLDGSQKEKPVFNALELFTYSGWSTYEADVHATTPEDVEALESLFDASKLPFEDWTSNTRSLCKACSEGRPYDSHHHDQETNDWNKTRRIAVAAQDKKDIDVILDQWANNERPCDGLELTLPSVSN